jgi:hypothetical protein
MTIKIKNPEFYKYLKAATKETSDLLHDIKSGRIEPPNDINDVIANESSFVSCVGYLMESYDIEWIKRLPNENRLEEIRKTLLYHIKNYLGSPYLKIEGIHIFMGEEDDIISHSFPDYFIEFNEQTFNEYYTEYEEYLSSASNKPITYQIVVALENFGCDFSSATITLSNNVRIVPGSSTFYSDAIGKNMNLWRDIMGRNIVDLEIGNYEPPEFFLEIDYEMEKKKVPSEYKEFIEHISLAKTQNVFKTLRLYKEGSFTCGLIYWCSKTPCDPPYNDDYTLYYAGNHSELNAYILQKDGDVEKLQQLFEKYSNNSNKKDFPHSAIYYLDKGIRENDIADRLVDYTAGLESLFVDKKEGITTQLAHRTAFFLEEDRQKCRDIYKDIKKAYDVRSKIVHGDYHKIKGELKLEEYCNKTERYARRAISKWIDKIDKGNNAKDIYDSIVENPFS